jgi:hypothetical protein
MDSVADQEQIRTFVLIEGEKLGSDRYTQETKNYFWSFISNTEAT